jgi:hypothetical protein
LVSNVYGVDLRDVVLDFVNVLIVNIKPVHSSWEIRIIGVNVRTLEDMDPWRRLTGHPIWVVDERFELEVS